jgi:hypothetical protein
MTVCGRGDGERWSNVMYDFDGRSAQGCVRRPQRPVHISDDGKEHPEGFNVTCAAKRWERIFGKTIDLVCLTVACVEETLNMFPGCLYSVCMGASPSRTRLKFRADCNKDIAYTLTNFVSSGRVVNTQNKDIAYTLTKVCLECPCS